VVHGYRGLGYRPAVIVYFTIKPYFSENPDEYCLSYNDSTLGFEWRT
jgi:dTDP-4-dehydrorhamnose 3,5-epimerase-like enzyme